jgi:hypothetical protein
MRNTLVIALVGLLFATVPGFAVDPVEYDQNDPIPDPQGDGIRVDCEGDIEYDTGFFDDFVPPVGCGTAMSTQCFINAINEGELPADGRRLADDWFSMTGEPITAIKVWGRYNAEAYEYHGNNPGSLHGWCVKFYQMTAEYYCPDGSIPGEDAIGAIVYDYYTDDFIEEELVGGQLGRHFNYCIYLHPPFDPEAFGDTGAAYWVSVSPDFDMILYPPDAPTAWTQWFWRTYQGMYDPFCEMMFWDLWNEPATNWMPVGAAVGLTCWDGWNLAFVLYAGDYVPPTAVKPVTWGSIKSIFK